MSAMGVQVGNLRSAQRRPLRLVMITMLGCALALPGCARDPAPDVARGAAMDAAPRVTDFSGLWVSAGVEYVKMPEENDPKFTEAAQRNLAEYRRLFDPATEEPAIVCLLKGMPWTILLRPRDYPVEIYQTPERLIMFFELYDTHRNVFLDRSEIPEDVPYSGNGYSVGRWDGDALVIETGQMTALNPIGPYQRSSEARVEERWTLRQHPELGETLEVQVTVRDPLVYAEPGRGVVLFKRAKSGTKLGGYNCSENLWDSLVEKRIAERGAPESPAASASRAAKN